MRLKDILFTILAIIAGLFVGGIVNMGILNLIPTLFPYPEGLDPNKPNDIAKYMETACIGAFILVWLAHWGQAFVGSIVAAIISPRIKMLCALIVGGLTMVGGILAMTMIPSPVWNMVIDLLGYFPAAWVGAKIGMNLRPENRRGSAKQA